MSIITAGICYAGGLLSKCLDSDEGTNCRSNQTNNHPSAPPSRIEVDQFETKAGIFKIGTRVFHSFHKAGKIKKIYQSGLVNVDFDQSSRLTNVDIGVLVKAVEQFEYELGRLEKGTKVFHQSFNIGEIKEIFSNGMVKVDFNPFSNPIWVSVSTLAPKVKKIIRNSDIFEEKIRVYHDTNKSGHVVEMFADGTQIIDFDLYSNHHFVNTANLSIAIEQGNSPFGKVKRDDRVHHYFYNTGYIKEIFSNGIAKVNFDRYSNFNWVELSRLAKSINQYETRMGMLKNGDRVHHKDYHAGKIKEIFTNGIVKVDFDNYSNDLFANAENIAVAIKQKETELGVLKSGERVHHQSYRTGVIKEIFTNGIVKVDFDNYSQLFWISDSNLAPKVKNYKVKDQNFQEGSKIFHHSYKSGTVKEIFASGILKVDFKSQNNNTYINAHSLFEKNNSQSHFTKENFSANQSSTNSSKYQKSQETKQEKPTESHSQTLNTLNKAYETLGCHSQDSFETVRKNFKKLSLKFHPDKAKQNELPEKEAEEKFKSLLAAYEMIRETLEKN